MSADDFTMIELTSPAEPELELVLIPCAGSGPSEFREWPEFLPERWRVRAFCPPGREMRFGADFSESVQEMAAEAAEALGPRPDVPRWLLGHSMGAVVAFELGLLVQPDLVFVAACSPPIGGFADDCHDPSEEELRDAVREVVGLRGSAEPMLLDELASLTGPILCADLDILRRYRPTEARLDCPIVAYYGTEDGLELAPWSTFTSASSPVATVEGGHFFPVTAPGELIADMADRLDRV